MLLNACKKQVILFCLLLSIAGIKALARVDNNWSRRPNVTVAQHHNGSAGYRPVAGVGYQQPTQWNRQNYSNPQPNQWQHNNNRTQFNQPNYRPGLPSPAQTNTYRPQSVGATYPQYPARNQTRPNIPQYPSAAQHQTNYPAYKPQTSGGVFNQTRPQPVGPSYPQYPSKNQTRPAIPQYPSAVPQQPNSSHLPAHIPALVNNTRPQPSAPLLPNNVNTNPSVPTSNLYPKLPQLPQPAPQPNNGIPLAPLQPAQQNPQTPQGPHNWHSGGQAVLSYGPGHYPSPAGQPNKNQPNHQGSSNPYANMFI